MKALDIHTEEVAQETEKAIRKQKYKKLLKYEKSEEYSNLQEFCKDNENEMLEEIRNEIQSREKPIIEYSLIDERIQYMNALLEIIEEVTNEDFKEYLKNRYEAHVSFIENKVGEDTPLYTELDLMKFRRQEFHNIKFYIEFCISSFHDKKEEEIDESAY